MCSAPATAVYPIKRRNSARYLRRGECMHVQRGTISSPSHCSKVSHSSYFAAMTMIQMPHVGALLHHRVDSRVLQETLYLLTSLAYVAVMMGCFQDQHVAGRIVWASLLSCACCCLAEAWRGLEWRQIAWTQLSTLLMPAHTPKMSLTSACTALRLR
jgi:hypothetical protein